MEQERKDVEIKISFKMIFIFSTILIALLAIFCFLITNKIEKSINSALKTEIPVFEEALEEPKNTYILKEYNGKIGVFENESLIYTLNTYVFTLPENDKKLLNEGISVSTQEELYLLLEYYY